MPRARQSGPRWPKSLPLMMPLAKNLHPPSKNFFRVQTRRLAAFLVTSQGMMTSSEYKQGMHKNLAIINMNKKPKRGFELLSSIIWQQVMDSYVLRCKISQVSICGSAIFTTFYFLSHNFRYRYARGCQYIRHTGQKPACCKIEPAG